MVSPDFGRQVVEVASQLDWRLIYLTVVVGAIGLNFKQRQTIRERDGQCIDPDPTIKCSDPKRDEVDHLIPKEFAENVLGMSPEEYNDPANLARRCFNHHRGHPNSKHPDVHEALYEQREKHNDAIKRAIKAHGEKADNNQVYWNVKRGKDAEIRKKVRENNKKMDEKKGGRANWWPWG